MDRSNERGNERQLAPDPVATGAGGFIIVFVLLVLLLMSAMGLSLLYATNVDLRGSRVHSDWTAALGDGDAAVAEVRWRLNLRPGSRPPPVGSTVSVNDLVDYDARIDWDPAGLLDNGRDDDGDGLTDEADELNLARDWTVRMVLTRSLPTAGPPWQLLDTDPVAGPPWGSHLVVPTVQPAAAWKHYTTAAASADEVLVIRYQLDTDTSLGDSEGDGPEVVFYDPELTRNGDEDPNTLSALGGDSDPSTDSPYNISFNDGWREFPASGSPVLLVETTPRIVRNEHQVASRKVVAELVPRVRRPLDHALCGCQFVAVSGAEIDSYRSSNGPYGTAPPRRAGPIASNGNLRLRKRATIHGDVVAGGDILASGSTPEVGGDALAGARIRGHLDVNGRRQEHVSPAPAPCDCDAWDVVAMVDAARAVNDDDDPTRLLPGAGKPYRYGTKTVVNRPIYASARVLALGQDSSIILTGGSYYFDSLSISSSAAIQIGVDDTPPGGDGIVDAPPHSPVRIFVAGGMLISGRGFDNAGRPADLQIYVSTVPPPKLRLWGTPLLRGVIVAPYTDVDLLGDDVIEGAILARKITRFRPAPVHYDEDLRSQMLVRSSSELVAWREVR